MNDRDLKERLSRISTRWTQLLKAHEGPTSEAREAQQELMTRYCGAAYRYLLAAVRNPDAAEDLAQEFAIRFIQGRFRAADPARGRFRDYVKTCLFNLVADFRQRQAREPRAVPLGAHDPATPGDDPAGTDAAFCNGWRQELLARAWEALESAQEQGGPPYHTVLRFKVEHPEIRSPQMAEQLAGPLGRAVSADWVRKTLERARDKFGELLIDETLHSLGAGAAERLEEELAELNLLKYCEDVLRRRKSG
jgi:RNA polymerase sigma-70 factor (ECF subfamily)